MVEEKVNHAADEDWGHTNPGQEISVVDFEKLIAEAYEKKAAIKVLEDAVEAEKAIHTEQKAKIQAYMEQLGKTAYKSNYGTVSIKQQCSVETPKDPQDKRAFFKWLEDNGLYDQYVSVNSKSLNSLFNSQVEATGNIDLRLPGISAPKYFKTLSLLK